MKDKEKTVLEQLLHDMMMEVNGHATDEEVAEAVEQLSTMINDPLFSGYNYEHPDYGALVGDVPEALRPLLNNDEDNDYEPLLDDIMDNCGKMERNTLVSAVNSLIYYWLDTWHKVDGNDNGNGNDNEDEDIWLFPLHAAILIAERFALRECLPALLEIARQDISFTKTFFDDCGMDRMLSACLYQIITEEDLPLLADFIKEHGVLSFLKAWVVEAVATLPRRNPSALPEVQRWLCEALDIFADSIDPTVGDPMLIEVIVHGCIHTRCEAAKPAIIRLYSKYTMPNVLIPGGVNEVRKTIKRADIGVLDEDFDSAELVYEYADDEYDEYDDDDEYDDEYDDDEYDDEEYDDEEYDDEELAPQQEYCGYTMGDRAHYLPVASLKKYTLRIELDGAKPQVWRELEVPSSISLASLAQAILLAMGWDESHLHQFITKGRDYYATSLNEIGSDFSEGSKDGTRYSISHLLKRKGSKVVFEYDYGDSWQHLVELKATAKYADGEKKAVKLTGGANACPPDDCGGIYRYNHLVQQMEKHPDSRDLHEFYEWMGCKWNPAFFPLEEAASAVNEMN